MNKADPKDLPPSPLASRQHQLYPLLSQAQLQLMSRYGERRHIPAGEVLFRQGDRHVRTFVVLSGGVQVERSTALGSHVVGKHGPGMFSGDIGSLVGRGAVATVKADRDSEMLVIEAEAMRTLVISEADLSEIVMRAFILRRVAFIDDEAGGGVIVIGSRQCPNVLRLREFLARNGQPAAYFDIEVHEEAKDLMRRFSVRAEDIPAVITPRGEVLRNPSNRELADAIGSSPDALHGRHFDLAVVGAGPAGLAAAVYGASEGLRVIVLDAKAPGGQAGTSSKIENYFGFPTGISGRALAGRGLSQARKFGVEVAVPVQVEALRCDGEAAFDMRLDNGEDIHARAVVIATGARYRKPPLKNLAQFEGRGIYYNASFMEATYCSDDAVIVVGGGNSAGQAAVFLSGHSRHVHVMVRAKGLAASMSRYLIQRIEAAGNITLHTETEIVDLIGDSRLRQVRCVTRGKDPVLLDIEHVFLFLGADPCTAWLGDCVALDEKAFVLTGSQVPPSLWRLERPPQPMETSHPGIFAVGDVRAGSVKRVAAAVGEGAVAVQSLHEYFAG
ncbi:FAD-dependent oxidoreductase [Cupriavidus sp. 2TAF22]|uniref:FAD-dependent oxidoreductase n=1 Tax=unclassified Cupriavidus TaxID=2640874 RepID=UPI003F8E6B03